MTKKIGILTGGGDAPGLNPAIKWATKKAHELGYEVYGIMDGWNGLLDLGEYGPEEGLSLYDNVQKRLERSAIDLIKEVRHKFKFKELVRNAGITIGPLSDFDVESWGKKGGSSLGSSRTNPFSANNDRSGLLKENVKKLGLDYIIAAGGEDTLGAAYKASQIGINTIGIPKTIDGDLLGTDYTLGFETAVDVIKDTINDRLRGTSETHAVTTIVETMGRHSGLLAYKGGEVAEAFMVLIPEYLPSIEQISSLLEARKKDRAGYGIIVVSEGAIIKDYGGLVSKDSKEDEYGHKALGGVGKRLQTDIEKRTGEKLRCDVLGYTQRGANPNGTDVEMGRRFGIAAVELIEQGYKGRMVSYKNGQITHVSLEEVTKGTKQVDIGTMYDTTNLCPSTRALGL